MAECEQRSKEREIPLFTVLKNKCILKNIYFLDNPASASPFSAVDLDQDSVTEETLVVGRHPDCNIKLEHPSVSRFHLRILSRPISRSIFVFDLSSVHGTWISGKRIEAEVWIKLNDGDTLQLGRSTRLYKLHWIPISLAYDVENPFVPPLDGSDTVEEDDGEGEIDQDQNSLHDEHVQVQNLSDSLQAFEHLCSDENSSPSMKKLTTRAPLMPENLYNSFSMEEKVEDLFDRENVSPQTFPPSEVPQKQSQSEDVEKSGMKPEKQPGMSIWSRRGSVHIITEQSKEKNKSPNTSSQVKSLLQQKYEESVSKDTVTSPYLVGGEFHTPEKENTKVSEMKSQKILDLSIWSSRDEPRSVQIGTECRRKANVKAGTIYQLDGMEEIFTPEKENCCPGVLSVRNSSIKAGETPESIMKTSFSSNLDHDDEIFTPDKENMMPKTLFLLPEQILGKLEEAKSTKSSNRSSIKRSVNGHRFLYQAEEKQKMEKSTPKDNIRLKKEPYVLKVSTDRKPFQLLNVNSRCTVNCHSLYSIHEATMTDAKPAHYSASEEVLPLHELAQQKLILEETKRWTVVVDTACLLNKNSRKELHLLRGLKGTSLIIPRIVVRELDCMLRRRSFFTRMTEASAALQWIEDSMANFKWWIHVQSSAEEGKIIPPTPPASPHLLHEEKSAFSIGSIPFSPYSLQDIVTPTSEDHVLESALFFKQIKKNEQLVLLSDDVTLKIKAMAEGIVSETAEEFRRSLVNPFSERFLYADSSPRGSTWTFADDNILKEKYYPSPAKKLSKSGEDVEGLKLILLHNSSFGQITPVGKNVNSH